MTRELTLNIFIIIRLVLLTRRVSVYFIFGADGETRTPTPLRAQAPQACVSTNSTTTAILLFLFWNILRPRVVDGASLYRTGCRRDWSRLSGSRIHFVHQSLLLRGMRIKISQRQTGNKKQRRDDCRTTTEEICGTAGTKQTACRTRAKRRAHVGTFAVLQQHQSHQHYCRQNVHYPNQCFQLTAPYKLDTQKLDPKQIRPGAKLNLPCAANCQKCGGVVCDAGY